MRLRSFWIGDYRNLQEISLTFPDHVFPAIFMIAGVNGTGKSGILRMLSHVITTLEYARIPQIPFRLAYQRGLGNETYEVSVEGDGVDDVKFSITNAGREPRRLDSGEWQEYLPKRTIIYSSGSLVEWLPIFANAGAPIEDEDTQAAALRAMQVSLPQDEEIIEAQESATLQSNLLEEVESSRTLLFAPEQVRLALLATLALEEADKADLRAEIYQRAKLERLTHFALTLKPSSYSLGEASADSPNPIMRRIWDLANSASRRQLRSDGSFHLLFEMTPELRLKLGGDSALFATPELFYEFLADLQRRGILIDVDLILRKSDLTDDIIDRQLSDGEFQLVGRMALFLLLAQPESLFLLDEPETHFNDVWKRELVDLLAKILQGQPSTVLLATHSSIVLTDVYSEQIKLLKKEDGRTRVVEIQTPTFGADSGEVMVEVLGATESLGQRSVDQLEKLLTRQWTRDDLPELEFEIRRTGAGYYRSELRTLWRKLSAAHD